MDTVWQADFRERMRRFQGTPDDDLIPVSIKIRITSGCFHRAHSPEAYRIIDGLISTKDETTQQFQIEEHESGPEILVYLAITTAGLTFAKSVIDLITAIIKARSEGIKKGDRQTDPLELIVRGHHKNGEYFEEKILRIPHDEIVKEKLIEKALSQSEWVKKATTKKAAAKSKHDEAERVLIESISRRFEEDPLDRYPVMDFKTLNLIGEVALGETDSGTFTPYQLAEGFHAHLEKTFWNKVCDEDGSRSNMVGCLETALKTTDFRGTTSKKFPGFISIGTVLIKREVQESGVAFSFVRHPNLEKILKC
jgi:hypothetical protein